MKNIEVIGGGTVSHVRNHLALTAPAYGNTAREIYKLCNLENNPSLGNDYEYNISLHLTKMASSGESDLETNEDISNLVDKLILNPETKIIFFNPALVDFNGSIATGAAAGYEWYDNAHTKSGKYETRLKTSEGEQRMLLTPAAKILGKIRKTRKDIFLVAFKTTCGATEDEQFLRGLHLLKDNSCNLVLANDTKTRTNMIITPEQARYSVTTDRELALQELVTMTLARASNTFTRSTVVSGPTIPWDMENIPHSLKAVVEHCIAKGAYKLFNGSTVGHFAFKKTDKMFITSKRKVDFNKLKEVGMVMCVTNGDNDVVAYGSKPSVGGQSQRIIFREHPEMDSIIHFHLEAYDKSKLSVKEQKFVECGSHACGQNTSNGLRLEENGIKCVYLDNHGPNIVFNSSIDPQKVIAFIDKHFDFKRCTDGIVRN